MRALVKITLLMLFSSSAFAGNIVAVASQIIGLNTGTLCEISTWISSGDKYFEVLCLKEDGTPDGPPYRGGWSSPVNR